MPAKQIALSASLLNSRVGENIERARLQKKKSVKEMASLLHLTHTGYRNIERGKTEITIIKIYTIASILNISFLQLIDFEKSDSLKLDDASNNQVIETLRHYKKDEIYFLRRQLDLLTTDENILHNKLK